MPPTTARDYRILLSWFGEATTGLGALLREYPDPAEALNAPDARLAELPRATQRRLLAARDAWPEPGTACRRPRSIDAAADDNFLPIGDARYPDALRVTPDPPPWLFCRGDPDVLQGPAVAVVGSRRASHAGRAAATTIARHLADAGYLVCSGLALGIDAAAHRAALDAGRTAAVLASGLDRASPQRNLHLAEEIRSRGCLISELPYGTPPSRERFPRRNRIISGLCEATILVEAALPSGSLHTAAAALEQGRDIFALPWSVFHANGRGCLRLLRDGAIPITDLDELPSLFPPRGNAARQAELPVLTAAALNPTVEKAQLPIAALPPQSIGRPASDEQLIMHLIGDTALSAEELQRAAGLPTQRFFAAVTGLELAGVIERSDGLYRRVPVVSPSTGGA